MGEAGRGGVRGGARGCTKRPAAAVLKIPRKLIWARAQEVTRREGGLRVSEGGKEGEGEEQAGGRKGGRAGRGAAADLAGPQREARAAAG